MHFVYGAVLHKLSTAFNSERRCVKVQLLFMADHRASQTLLTGFA